VQGTYALEEWIELANGCLCCTVKSDFLRALEALMEQRNRFDYILIETTGASFVLLSTACKLCPMVAVAHNGSEGSAPCRCSAWCAGLADPGPVAAALWTDVELQSSVCLDSIVTVVDAHNLLRQLGEPRPAGAVNEAEQQVAFADVIMLNKVWRPVI
jgi:G3E family GTPase